VIASLAQVMPEAVGVVGALGLQLEGLENLDKRKTSGYYEIYGLQCHSGGR